MLPTLSQIYAWDTEHLIEVATYWTKTADQWEDVFLRIRNQSHTVVWEGAGGDGLRQRTDADLQIVNSKADNLRQATRIARAGAGTIGAAQRRVIYAVQDAHSAGFNVEEDLSVTDTRSGRTAPEHASRQAQAQAFASDIRRHAIELVGVEHQVAANITAATSGISFTAFPETPYDRRSQTQAVNHHTFKQDPPGLGPTNGPSADDIRRVLDKLPQGNKPEVREVRSPEDLRNLWKWAQQNGVEIPNGYGDPGKGIRYRLPDGTIIGQRWSAGSTSRPVLDFDIPGKGGGYTKIHINPRGGIPDIPAPARPPLPEAPAVRAPVEPPRVSPPPVEAVPGRAGPSLPFVGGSPVPPESIPHPVHPPHSHHGPPVLGKDELPDLDEFTPG